MADEQVVPGSAEQAPQVPSADTTPPGLRAGETTTPVARNVPATKTSVVWVTVGVGVVLLAAVLTFIVQNSQDVVVRFLAFRGSLPEGVALLFSALLGAAVVLLLGAARIIQLRRLHRQTSRGVRARRKL